MTATMHPVDHRFESAVAALAVIERVTLGDVQRVADALSLDEIELTNEVEAARKQAVSGECAVIHTDERGHITAYDDDGTILATVLDMGPVCAVDATVTSLTPDQAYAYGEAVVRWAATKRRAQRARAREAVSES